MQTSSFYYRLFSLTLLFWLGLVSYANTQVPNLLVTELLADPTFTADGKGEYLELGTTDSSPVMLTDFELRIEGRTWPLAALGWVTAAHPLLLCPDSVAAKEHGLNCDGELNGLTLPNGRPFAITLSNTQNTVTWIIPRSRPGEAIENSLDAEMGYLGMRPVIELFGGGTGNPGSMPQPTKLLTEINQESKKSATVLSDRVTTLETKSDAPLSISDPVFRGEVLSEDWHIVVIASRHSKRSLRLLNKYGWLIQEWSLNQKEAEWAWTGRDAHGNLVKSGPHVVVLQDGSAIYRKAFIVLQ